ncbi:serine/threonine-protein kinase [Nonomuraea sp. LPB2021202275-12-8]|uniref:serine/threonine-protein kinase n=1 Tax=Nonomuraea sp. LPB2021202275-12-8 TaxID=3120159 RepID=UPI00300C7209
MTAEDADRGQAMKPSIRSQQGRVSVASEGTIRAEPLRPGDPSRVGSYRLLGRLGEGGMGSVYLAYASDNRPVAVKMIHASLASNAEFRRRFRREVESVRRVPPFCTAEVLDADPDHDPPYLVVEYVDGPSLADVVRSRGPFTPANLHGLAIGVAAALTAIHNAGVIHRDLKPSNVMLALGGPKVIDFGIAREVDSATVLSSSQPGQLIGTVLYMAPERFSSGDGYVLTPAVDVFAWGVVMAYAGTGRTPFAADSLPGVAARIMAGPPVLDGLDPSLRPLVEQALAKDPAERPTAHQLLQRLLGQNIGARGTELRKNPHKTVTDQLNEYYTPPGSDPDSMPTDTVAGITLSVEGTRAEVARTAHITVTARNNTGHPVDLDLEAMVGADVTAAVTPSRLSLREGETGYATVTATSRRFPPLRAHTHRLTMRAADGNGRQWPVDIEFRQRIHPIAVIGPAAALVFLVLFLVNALTVARLIDGKPSTSPSRPTQNPSGPFRVAIGDIIEPGKPGAGAGVIESVGARDVYIFSGGKGQRVFFDVLEAAEHVNWRLSGPDGKAVFDGVGMYDSTFDRPVDQGTLVLSQAGEYQLVVHGDGDATGAYRVRVWSARDSGAVALRLGDEVSDGRPVGGAGNIESPGVRDVYEFSAKRDQRVYFDAVEASEGLRWALRGPDGKVVFDGVEMYDSTFDRPVDQGTLVLSQAGEYQLIVYGNGDATGAYRVRVWSARDSGAVALRLGDEVSDGRPVGGAGNIESPGVRDVYEFSAKRDQRVYFDAVEASEGLRWALRGPDGKVLFDGVEMYDSTFDRPVDQGTLVLSQAGEYQLIVYGNGDATGTYRVRVWSAQDSGAVALRLGDEVSDGRPVGGAGNIESPGVRDVYEFSAKKDQRIYLDVKEASEGLRWALRGPDSKVVFDGVEMYDSTFDRPVDQGTLTLSQAGGYQLIVYGNADATGTYRMKIERR